MGAVPCDAAVGRQGRAAGRAGRPRRRPPACRPLQPRGSAAQPAAAPPTAAAISTKGDIEALHDMGAARKKQRQAAARRAKKGGEREGREERAPPSAVPEHLMPTDVSQARGVFGLRCT
jgi:hypothetical protein